MTALGPFLFGAPWALAALIALPVIWWILRATPPAPKDVELPSMRILEGMEPKEETPARTPWWVWLIRYGRLALSHPEKNVRLESRGIFAAYFGASFVLGAAWVLASNPQGPDRSTLP